MAKLTFPTPCPIQDLLRSVADHVAQLKHMWPSFGIKIVAIKHGGTWKCCYLGVAGRFTPLPERFDWKDEGDSIATIQIGLSGDAAWDFLRAMSDTGHAMLDAGITTLKICVPSLGGGSVQYHGWMRHADGLQPGLNNVREHVEWSVLAVSCNASWHFGDELLAIDTATQQTLSDSLNWSLEPSAFFERQMGVRLGLGECLLDVHLPLGVIIARGASSLNGTPLHIKVLDPLAPEQLQLTYSADMVFRSDMPMVSVSDGGQAPGGWRAGTALLPINHGMLSIRHPLLDRPLHYEYPEDPSHAQALTLISYLYSHNDLDRGLRKWTRAMSEGVGSEFEVALLNAIARFGWSVLFAGQVPTEAQSGVTSTAPAPPQVSAEGRLAGTQGREATAWESDRMQEKRPGGGPQTEGFDMIVLDPESKRILLVSAKGGGSISITALQRHVGSLNAMVDRLRKILAEWNVGGLVVCNKIVAAQLDTVSCPPGIRMVGNDWVKCFLTCAERPVAESLLWDTEL